MIVSTMTHLATFWLEAMDGWIHGKIKNVIFPFVVKMNYKNL